jgi:hypothetical protein
LSVGQLVGAREEEAGYFDPKRLRSLQVEALELASLVDRYVARLPAGEAMMSAL